MPASDYLSRYGIEPGIRRATAGSFFSAAGGAVIIVQSVLILLYGEFSIFWTLTTELQPEVPYVGLGIGLLGIFGIVIGIAMLGGAFLIFNPGFEIIGGVVVLIFSIVSIIVGGGWLVGFALGMLGGFLGLFRK